MIRLEAFSSEVAKKHTDLLESFVRKRLAEVRGRLKPNTVKATAYLDELILHLGKDIKQWLLASPAELRQLVVDMQNQFALLDKALATDPASRNDAEKDIVEQLLWVYDYVSFSNRARSKWSAYALVDQHGLRICPYCHAVHLNFHVNETKEMRPPLDHFFPRSRYPYLGICLYNLIPSCHQCNSSIKRDEDTFVSGMLHPQEIDEKAIKFRLKPGTSLTRALKPEEINIEIVTANADVRKVVDFFHLPARYAWYNHEIAEVHQRVLSQSDATGVMRRLIGVKRFVYGFSEGKARERMLGKCIQDIADDLAGIYVVS